LFISEEHHEHGVTIHRKYFKEKEKYSSAYF